MKKVDLVVIDYLGLMKSAKSTENRVQEVSEITRNLKIMAKELKIPVITCAQLSRGTEGRGKSHRPQLADLRESGSIEQDADIVLMLYRDEYYENDKENKDNDGDYETAKSPSEWTKVEVIVAKNRHGSVGTVELTWNPFYTVFGNPDKFER